MKQWKYTMEMKFINGDKIADIKTENFKSLIIESDYNNTNMPMLYTILHLDKNLIDSIILNADTAYMNLTIYKFVANSDDKTKEIYIRGQFNYFISGDINYNKDIDYMGDNENRQDVYKEISIGLLLKESIDNNKKSFNTAIVNTTMVNAVNLCTKHMPMLMEPFNYNETIDQLIVPPMDSVSKTLKFLNGVSVFYDTPYRFFMDFDTNYLISSSGKPIPKKDELYNTVMISMHRINDQEANTIGMSEDTKNKCYTVDINVVDSHYAIDKSTEKSFNNITAILDISKEKAESFVSDISKGVKEVTTCIQNLNGVMGKNFPSIRDIPTTIYRMNRNTSNSINNINGYKSSLDVEIGKLKTAIDAAPLPAPVVDEQGNETPGEGTDREALKKKIDEAAATITTNVNKLPDLDNTFKSITGGVNTNFANVSDITSYVNGITPINIGDNLNPLEKLARKIEVDNKSSLASVSSTLMPKNNETVKINESIEYLLGLFTGLSPDLAEDKTMGTSLSTIESLNGLIKTELNNITGNVNTLGDMPNKLDGITVDIKPMLTRMQNVNVDLKGQFTNMDSQMYQLTTKAKNMLSSLHDQLDKGLNGINMGSLSNIKMNLNKIKDISAIGRLGIPKFDAKLNLGGDLSDQKDRIIRVINDNANMVKNLKAQVESASTKLTINKNDLDASVFTINKEYIIKNYDVHADKDGKFLLTNKKEIYLREDDTFVLNTMLEFNIIKINE